MFAGAAHDTVREPLPEVTRTEVGAPGTPAVGVPLSCAEGWLSPAAFIAYTRTSYCAPLSNLSIVCGEAAALALDAPSHDATALFFHSTL